jgi:hypothetical protein
MPAQDDWLNDLSSTPPVSSTMQALNAVPLGAALPVEPPPLSAGLLPHPASSSALATAHTPIVTPRDPAKTDLLQTTRGKRNANAARGTEDVRRPVVI